MERIAYKGWNTCIRLTNGIVELVITADVGPRIIRFGFVGGENEFDEDWLGVTGGDTWRNYGGHRLWHAPEHPVRTYAPDNSPVAVEEHDGFVRFIQPLEVSTGIQKELDVSLASAGTRVRVVHRLRNTNLWGVELAPWALSVMAAGGVAILPLPPRGSHEGNLLPSGALTLWPYTDMADPRWTWGTEYALLRQDPQAQAPQKLGTGAHKGWIAYARRGHLFVIYVTSRPGATYPDLGSVVESFTNARMLELETLGPLAMVAPGAEVEHVEEWALFEGVATPTCDADVAAIAALHSA
ncbi:MAG TPA: hypothetical protein PKL16_10295 [Anaerolineae bacterium]|nr:hypothetical protein [Anaerolineae bacterium]HQM15328.1 hypothetical protein [Anaerolineae bacterium]